MLGGRSTKRPQVIGGVGIWPMNRTGNGLAKKKKFRCWAAETGGTSAVARLHNRKPIRRRNQHQRSPVVPGDVNLKPRVFSAAVPSDAHDGPGWMGSGSSCIARRRMRSPRLGIRFIVVSPPRAFADAISTGRFRRSSLAGSCGSRWGPPCPSAAAGRRTARARRRGPVRGRRLRSRRPPGRNGPA